MPCIEYIPKRFRSATLAIIQTANEIVAEYADKGYDMTLRQVYYQFIARDAFPDSWIDEEYNLRKNLPRNTKNTVKNYQNLGSIINDARLAGLIDWEHITDRTRNLQSFASWQTTAERIESAAQSFRLDRWADQPYRLEVWVEKDALRGVIENACRPFGVPFTSCRGYMSQSEQWAAAMRLKAHYNNGQTPCIIHLGDHDPSGIDMSRDIQDRLTMFVGDVVEFERVALNMDQVRQYRCPPNPAKSTDCRYEGYAKIHGDESWELDALSPDTMGELIAAAIRTRMDAAIWDDTLARETNMRNELLKCSRLWPQVKAFLRTEA